MPELLRRLIHNAINLGIDPNWTVENAAAALTQYVISQCAGSQVAGNPAPQALICVSSGFYGSVGLSLARHLNSYGWNIGLVLVTESQPHDPVFEGVYRSQLDVIDRLRCSVRRLEPDTLDALQFDAYALVVDALGVSPPIPRAAKTAEFRGALISLPGSEQSYERWPGASPRSIFDFGFDRRVATDETEKVLWAARMLGLPTEVDVVLGPGDFLDLQLERPPDAAKGDYGQVLVIGGSRGRGPAPVLAGMAALRTGVDWIALFVPECITPIPHPFSSYLYAYPAPGEYIAGEHRRLFEAQLLTPVLRTVLIGPGLSKRKEVLDFIPYMIKASRSMGFSLVLDADALKADIVSLLDGEVETVITPNKAEFARLFGIDVADSIEQLAKQVQQIASEYNITIILKGSRDIISNGVTCRINETGNSAMTVAGTGDVLAGLVAGFMAQGIAAYTSACLGTYLSGLAGDMAFHKWGNGLAAPDVLECVPEAMSALFSRGKG